MPIHSNPAVWKANCEKEERMLHHQAVQRSLLSKEQRIDALAIFRTSCKQHSAAPTDASTVVAPDDISSGGSFLDALSRPKASIPRGTLLVRKDEKTLVQASSVDSRQDPLQRGFVEAHDTSNRAYGWQATPKDAVPIVWHGRRKQTDIGNSGQRPQK